MPDPRDDEPEPGISSVAADIAFRELWRLWNVAMYELNRRAEMCAEHMRHVMFGGSEPHKPTEDELRDIFREDR